MKVKFTNDGKKETTNSKYIKKSKAHDLECVNKKMQILNLNEKLEENSNPNYFKMEAMKKPEFKFNFHIE